MMFLSLKNSEILRNILTDLILRKLAGVYVVLSPALIRRCDRSSQGGANLLAAIAPQFYFFFKIFLNKKAAQTAPLQINL